MPFSARPQDSAGLAGYPPYLVRIARLSTRGGNVAAIVIIATKIDFM
jgi:hypothetical protein